MADGDNVTLVRLDHLEGDVAEIKESAKEHSRQLSLTREDFASLKTEVRIVGGIVLGTIATLIGIVLNHVLGP